MDFPETPHWELRMTKDSTVKWATGAIRNRQNKAQSHRRHQGGVKKALSYVDRLNASNGQMRSPLSNCFLNP